MSNDAKLLRKQLKNVGPEVLKEILSEELKSQLYKELARDIQLRLTQIESMVKSSLEEMNERSKTTLDYLVRQAATAPVEVKKNEE